jgi:hypothetical protein
MNVKTTKVMRISRQPSPVLITINKKLEIAEYLNCFCNVRCTGAIKSRIAAENPAFNRKLDFNLRKKLIKFCIWNTPLTSAETWTLWKDQKYLQKI